MKRMLNMLIFLTTLNTSISTFTSTELPKEQQFVQTIENLDLEEIPYNIYNDKFSNVKTWINKSVTIGGTTITPLQSAVNKYEELQNQLNVKDSNYEQKLEELKKFETIIVDMIVNDRADTEKLTSQQQRIPWINRASKKKKILELVDLLNKAFDEKSELKHKQITEDIKKQVAEYLDKGGELAVDNFDLVQNAIEYDNLPVLELIIEKTKINPTTYTFNNDTVYPIIAAVKRGAERVMAYLIQKGANIDVKDSREQSPLLISAQRAKDYSIRYLNIFKALLDAGADTKGIEKYVTPSTDDKKNYDYNQDVANYYQAWLAEQKRNYESKQTPEYKEWLKEVAKKKMQK